MFSKIFAGCALALLILLGLTQCRQNDPVDYPQTYKLQSVNIDPLQFYRKRSDGTLEKIAPDNSFAKAWGTTPDSWQTFIREYTEVMPQITLLSETRARLLGKDQGAPNSALTPVEVDYLFKDGKLVVNGEDLVSEGWVNGLQMEATNGALSYHARLYFGKWYDPATGKRAYTRANYEMGVSSDSYEQNAQELLQHPFLQGRLLVGDTLVLSVATVRYQRQ